MLRRPLGSSGIDASVVGFGAWAIGGWMWGGTDHRQAVKAIRAAIGKGVNFIDTAPIYGFGLSERIVGEAVRDQREDVVLATKCGLVWNRTRGEHYFNSSVEGVDNNRPDYRVYKNLDPDSIREEVEQSLRRLHTDYIDLYQAHWPDRTIDIDDTMNELMKLRQAGKIRAIGVSNVSETQLEKYLFRGPIDTDQELFSMLDRTIESERLPFCREQRISFLAYSPLARGLLAGKISSDRRFGPGDHRASSPRFSPENLGRVQSLLDALRPVAESRGITLGQLAIAWTLAKPGCTHALVGARTPQQAIENAAAGRVELEADEMARLERILAEHARDIV